MRPLVFLFRLSFLVVSLQLCGQPQLRDLKIGTGEATGRRLALAIGIDGYAGVPLKNARNDARAIAASLREVGFDVKLLEDIGKADFARAVDQFAARIERNDTVVFFFAGHGLQVEGENYLVPRDHGITSESDVRYEAYSAMRVRRKIEEHGARLTILILDACRNNPFMGTRGGARGLAPMAAGAGTFVAFSAGDGEVADDNAKEKNGLFTKFLVAEMKQSGLSLLDLFEQVKAKVYEASSRRQTPYVYSGVIGKFYFRAPIEPTPKPPAEPKGEMPAQLQTNVVSTVQVNVNSRDGLSYSYISGGVFKAGCVPADTGCSGERLTSEVAPFWIGQREVTVADYERYSKETGMGLPEPPQFNQGWVEKNQPIVKVSHREAAAFCAWAGGALPTIEQWEYAARGGLEDMRLPWGNAVLRTHANYGSDRCCNGEVNGFDRWEFTAPVASFPSNTFRLHDMIGNVAEWTGTRGTLRQTPIAPLDGTRERFKVAGGSWATPASRLRSSLFDVLPATATAHDIGFRCVMPVLK